jgi:transcription elongation factor GreA
MAEKFPMTPRGNQLLKDELKRLKEVDRIKNSRDIEEARAHGDLKENAEYHAAKEKQSFIEGRIRELETKLALSNVIDPKTLSGNKAVFGATVTLEDGDGERQTYRIVGDDEADIKSGMISVSAPVARAIIGREVGEEVQVRTPKGLRAYELIEVKFE